MRWTKNEMLAYMAKRAQFGQENHTPDPGRESTLQKRINKWARDNGYPILSFRQSKNARGFLPPGWPDICLILPQRVVFIELKASKGRLSKDQNHTKLQFLFLGAEWFECRSYRRFLEIVSLLDENTR